MNYKDIIEKLRKRSNPKALAGMAGYAIDVSKAFGVSIPELRKLAKEIGTNDVLANELWEGGYRETRILAGMIANPENITESQIENWVHDFDSWEICDQCCMNLLEKTHFAYSKAKEWANREPEFVKRAGFVLMARLAVSDKAADNSRFEAFFPIIRKEATDERNFVKKAINWALRQIGKRNPHLNAQAIEVALEMRELDSKAARWIANDALKELKSTGVQKRLRNK